MKVFLCGLPKSGRTTIAKAIVEAHGFVYIDATGWIRSSFRDRKEGEHINQYEDEYQSYFSQKMIMNPWFISDHVKELLKNNDSNFYIIDGISSPKDFSELFDYREDIVIFLNRVDNDHEYRDHESIGVSVIRDYCFWMSAVGTINKNSWIEYNFKVPGEDSDFIKSMGARNSVFITKSINRVISHLTERLSQK